MGRTLRFTAAAAAAVVAQGCAGPGTRPDVDPWEGYNRGAFAFNEAVDRHVAKPMARGYEAVAPAFVRSGVNNFFGNLADAWTGANQLLQGKLAEAASDAARVLVNTTVGVFGLVDVASEAGLAKHEEDFGQTLAVWGVGPGPYVVVPFLGPGTARDAPARLIDPSWWVPPHALGSNGAAAAGTLDAVRTRANLLAAGDAVEAAALDRYTFVRDAWLQRRRAQVHDGNAPAQPLE